MRQKIVLLIAIILAIGQGIAAAEAIFDSSRNPSIKAFRTHIGQQVTDTVSLSFTGIEVSIDPDPDPTVVDRSSGESDSSDMMRLSLDNDNYSISIEGANNQMFSAEIVQTMFSTNNNKVTVWVRATYSPTEGGIHKASLIVLDNYGTSRVSMRLHGEAMTLKGDVYNDGQISIEDVTTLIDYILNDDDTGINLDAADVDYDGSVTVADITALIDVIFGASQTKICTFLIITKTDENTYEYPIDENSKVEIIEIGDVKWLNLEMGGIGYIFSLNDIEQLRYEQREVTNGYKLATKLDADEMIKADSLTIKTDMP